MRRPTSDDGFGVLIALVFLAAIVVGVGQCVGDGIDWLDRRACRVAGGRVERVERTAGEWRCVGASAERAP